MKAQEILLFHHLALLTSRTYVYQPFIWQHRHASLPLSAFLLGPTKYAISSALFDQICPPDKVRHVHIDAQPGALWTEAQRVLNTDAQCVSVDNRIFSWAFLASDGTHSIWPSFQTYLATHFKWPVHIQNLAERTYSALNLRSPSTSQGEPYIAVHLRRGDFESHCDFLAQSASGFTTWATLPVFQDSLFPPSLDARNKSSIIEHCYPSLYRILDAIDFQIRSRPHVRAVYALHDGAWDHLNVYVQLYKLEYALKSSERAQTAGWSGAMRLVTHSGMVPVSWGERDFKVAVDIEIARHAAVFIGNGYSSLSSTIMALRLADGGNARDIGLF